MPTFLPQAQIEPPRNALINFAPLTQAIEGANRNAFLRDQQQLERDRFALQQEQMGLARQKMQRDQISETVQRLGRRAQAIDALPPGDPRRAQAWAAILKEHPNAGGLEAVWQDPVQGPKMLIAEAGEWMDPQKRALLEAQVEQARAGVANIPLQRELLQAQIAQAKQKDVMAEMQAGVLAEVFPGLRRPQAVPAPAAPAQPPNGAAPGGATLRPMGDAGGSDDPLLHQAQAVAPEATAPPAPGVADRLTPAQRQAMGLALIGKGDAGKILLEADNANKLAVEAKNQVEKDMVASVNQLARIEQIAGSFQDRFQTLGGKVKNRFNSWVDYIDHTRRGLNPADRQELAEFTAFRRDAFENLNRYIKEITGAQMSEAEAQRLMRAMPNPGTSLWDGDSPTEFRSKMDSVLRQTKLALARMAYLRRHGFAGDGTAAERQLPLERMEGIIQQRTNELLQEALRASPGARPADVVPLIRQRLKSEFGISA